MGDIHDAAAAAADLVAIASGVTIISHIDADGICSEAILSLAIERQGIPTKSIFVRQLEPSTIETVPKDDSLKIFVDLGSGQQNLLVEHDLSEKDVLILDHHVGQPADKSYHEINALSYGHNKLSASGVAYLVARELDAANIDLAKIAVVGNVGDMLARANLGLTGPSREIVNDGVSYGIIRVLKKDLNCFGISTRPVHLCLTYCDDPFIPEITNNQPGALQFLNDIGVPLQDETGKWIVWEKLPVENKKKIISSLTQHLLHHNRNPNRLLAENYLFPNELEGTPLRNAAEFATFLNACGRWDKPVIGSRICKGDRKVSYHEAERMLIHHRSMIRELLQFILETGAIEISHLQYIHVQDRFPDTIIGIGAGMALSRLNRGKPILIMAEMSDDPLVTKISMRTNEEMVERGVDLQQAIVNATAEVGGYGGGHRIAAGGYIPKDVEEKFIQCVNQKLEAQVRGLNFDQ